MKVDELPIDERIKRVIKERGIEELYPPPQAEALKSGVLEGEESSVSYSNGERKDPRERDSDG